MLRGKIRLLTVACLAVLLTACASIPGQLSEKPAVVSCLSFYSAIDSAVRKYRKEDAQYPRVRGFPYLRTSRFLASFQSELNSAAAYKAWLGTANQLSQRALSGEFLRLPTNEQHAIAAVTHLPGRLSDCGDLLVAELAEKNAWREKVMARAQVQPDYRYWQRVIGLYPLTAIPFRRGVVEEHDLLARLEREFESRGDAENYHMYQFPPVARLKTLPIIATNAAGIPDIAESQQWRLLTIFAPEVAVAVADQNNSIGRIELSSAGVPRVNTDDPVVYGWVDYGRYRGASTVRLNYSFWFARRPAKKPFDLLSGELDGLTWRVHLTLDGTVLAWDSAHNCGCWYRLYPAVNYRVVQPQRFYREPVYVGNALTEAPRKTLFLQTDNHHIVGVRDTEAVRRDTVYQLQPYRALKQIPVAGSIQSVFKRSGLVPISRRAERFVFWPMGVPSPGAMRVAGTHAIAFIGTRHFDDAHLLDEIGLQPKNGG